MTNQTVDFGVGDRVRRKRDHVSGTVKGVLFDGGRIRWISVLLDGYQFPTEYNANEFETKAF